MRFQPYRGLLQCLRTQGSSQSTQRMQLANSFFLMALLQRLCNGHCSAMVVLDKTAQPVSVHGRLAHGVAQPALNVQPIQRGEHRRARGNIGLGRHPRCKGRRYTSRPCLRRNPAFQCLPQARRLNGLAQVVVHARGQTALVV